MYEMTTKEIAEALGWTEDTVKSVLRSAIYKVKKRKHELEHWLEEEPQKEDWVDYGC